MLEVHSDLWERFGEPGHRIAISTNGFVKKNGEAVMGRGCALQATKLFPGIALRFGRWLKKNGNVPGYLFIDDPVLVAASNHPTADCLMILPVKHNWWQKADIRLICTSATFLMQEAEKCPDWVFHVPRLGCGNGRLEWESDVRPWMVGLPDNVVVHS